MMGIHDKPTVTATGGQLVPPVAHGVKVMSIGLLLEDDQPVIWRGPMITKTIQQFFMSVAWTTWIFCSWTSRPARATPSFRSARPCRWMAASSLRRRRRRRSGWCARALPCLNKVNVPILGMVENMSYFTTPTGDRVEIFGHGGGHAEAGRQKAAVFG
jgi:ATP-binding protein involved in chromosome partitioning